MMRHIVIEDDVFDGLNKLGIEYEEGDIHYKIDWYDARPYIIGFGIGVLVISICFAIILGT